MGDLNTVDVASAAHENVFVRKGLFPKSEKMMHGHRVPQGKMWTGLYIDDYLLLFRVPRGRARAGGLDSERSRAVSAAYVEAGLEEGVSKAFEQQVDFT